MKRVRKKKKQPPKGYDSTFEYELSQDLGEEWEHHPSRISYVSKHTYQPDFRREKDGVVQLIEAKGRFRTRNEASKYIAIREALKDNEELVFIFYDATVPLVGARRRKDGTKQSHGDWATLNNFRWYCRKSGSYDELK